MKRSKIDDDVCVQTIIKRYVVPQGRMCNGPGRTVCFEFSNRRKKCMAFKQYPFYVASIGAYLKTDTCMSCEVLEKYPDLEAMDEFKNG